MEFIRYSLGLADKDEEVTVQQKRTTFGRIWRGVLAEFIASALFTYFAIIAFSASQSSGFARTAAEPLLIGLAEGTLLTALIFTFAKISGGHVNPAVTLGFILMGSMPWLRGVLYMIAQLSGALLGAIGARGSIPSTSFGIEGVTTPSNGEPVMKAFVMETFLTFCWVHTIIIYKDPELRAERVTIIRALVGGFAVGAGVMIAQPFTGGSLNPARSFGAAVIAGEWEDHWIYWAAPLVGSVIAALLVRFLWQTRPPPNEDGSHFVDKQ